MSETKVMSLRLSQELADELDAVARVEDVSVSAAIRAAAHHYIATCRSSQAFKKRLKTRLEEDREVLERLSGEKGAAGKEN
jgi:metal-responsive CopG/Arc/MetJ family transcriptional regulator